MKIHSVIRKGSEHRVFCEDYVLHVETERYICASVLDGCSTGIDSHFASSLFGKSIKSNFVLLNYPMSLEETIKAILRFSIFQVNTIKTVLKLVTHELLCTIILSLYDKKTKELYVIVVGDGVFVVNGERYIIDQNNIPDYISYKLEELVTDSAFESWFATFDNKFRFDNVEDYTISTDGILSFKKIKEGEEIDPIDFFANDKMLINNSAMLSRKCNIIENKAGMINQDDLGIIRVCNLEEKKEE